MKSEGKETVINLVSLTGSVNKHAGGYHMHVSLDEHNFAWTFITICTIHPSIILARKDVNTLYYYLNTLDLFL